jgi:hypothetical protein
MSLLDEATPPRNSRAELASGSGGLVVPKAASGRSVDPPTVSRQRRHRPEDAIQRAIVQHYRQRAAPGVFMFAVPNGGSRRPVEAAILKATGTVAGIPDTIWIKDGQVYALELKAPGGRLTPAQEGVLVALRAAGAIATHCHGIDHALQILERWQLLRGHAE